MTSSPFQRPPSRTSRTVRPKPLRALGLAGLALALGGAAAQRPADLVVEGSISSIQQALLAHSVTCVEIVQAYAERIARLDKSSGLNAITEVNAAALDSARRLDQKLRRGERRGALFCVPLLVKDNIDVGGLPTTAGSIALKDHRPSRSSFIVQRLEAADAIVLAKTNMGEWAFSPRETVSSSYGVTANAYDRSRTPAGSSGGTASGITASFGLAGLGTDTGNSVRGPSSHAALVGMRPTLGLVSRTGIVPLFLDRDTAGPMTRTVEDNARLLSVIAGPDARDAMTAGARGRVQNYAATLNRSALRGARLGVIRALAQPASTDPKVLAVFNQALTELSSAGAVLIDLPFDDLRHHWEEGYYCSRFVFDANRYLATTQPKADFDDVRKIFAAGAYATHNKAEFENYLNESAADPTKSTPPCPFYLDHPGRRQFRLDVIKAMDDQKLDALIYPSWTILPPRLEDVVSAYRGDNSQLISPATGLPAITLPAGFADGLPIGLQMLGRPFDEARLYALAYAYEQSTKHRRPPPGFEALAAGP